jgi:hypothetical protein
MTLINTFAGIGWDPELRGILAVAAGTIVWMGSIYLILATNLANRLGFMVALAGFFGWMVILGLFWWIKPSATGPAGRAPSWEIEEVNTGDLTQATLEDARALGADLDSVELPSPEELSEMTVGQFEAAAAEVEPELSDWKLIAPSDPSRGEAQATVDEYLTSGEYPGIDSTDDYVAQYAFETGGKPERTSDGWFGRAADKVARSVRITHPPHYAIIQVCPSTAETRAEAAEAGQAPPTPTCDQNADKVNIVLVRDLGQQRLPVALFTIGSGLIFALLCYMLHVRDRVVAEHRSAPLPAPATGA